jgi:hypothetical protein
MGCGEHDWEPNLRWYGRYRCKRCRAIGYRQVVLAYQRRDPDTIKAYVCSVQGCKADAVWVHWGTLMGPGRKVRLLCAEHAKGM